MMGRVLILAAGVATVISTWYVGCQLREYRRVAAAIAWIPPARFERLTAVTLGTGTAYENPRRAGPAVAIGWGDGVVLVDAGRGVAEALRRAEISVAQPAAVYLTALLPENTVGLDDLLFAGWMARREAPLRLVGPPGTAELAEGLARGHAAGRRALDAAGLAPGGAPFEVVEVAGERFEERVAGGLRVRAGRVDPAGIGAAAGPVRVAYGFAAGGREAVVAGAGAAGEALAAFAGGASLLIAEGFSGEAVERAIEAGAEDPGRLRREAELHTDVAEIAAAAERAGVGGLVLTRLRPPPLQRAQYRDPAARHFAGPIAVAEDGDRFVP